jgi:hypothetical protein
LVVNFSKRMVGPYLWFLWHMGVGQALSSLILAWKTTMLPPLQP